ncbi:Rnf-Nqr domain containing protein [Pseudomonas donghuensis]|uniref:NADH:quinone oxidoreductase n=1 Tax=Pseudomonas donghuensis TaxID=1163398 RepID=A0AAP0SG94_9PSED|nr:Rnf-Nqr domain containing protein [Pseudomonas donghuensis]KDN97549.2 NADH:quinone oxidoreductase [Pseudomonas donghuensis]MCP6690516.1 NADH:quinone oxidoreductase [Pseudomonas donghuensis]MDF9894986.1 electron transport complex protein RnfE [Pseudomonas vranovensis]UVL23269.1 NADH:quinone oxidoreductase [Pseudomonas donghuensis]
MNRQWLAAISLAPLLGATQTLAQASAIALLSLLIIGLHRLCMTPLHKVLEASASLIASVLLAALLVTCLELTLRAWALPLSLALGPYSALIAVQCLVFEFAQGASGRWRTAAATLGGFALLCMAMGLFRQGLGEFANLRLASLLPGALILLGLMLALYNRVCRRPAPTRRQGKR